MKTIGIIGTRRKDDNTYYSKLIKKFLEVYKDGDHIVSGGCQKGGDRLAELLAKENQIPIKIHYACWRKFGKAAGMIRNTDIAKESDVLIAIVAGDRTGGTEDTIKKFTKKFKKNPDNLHLIF